MNLYKLHIVLLRLSFCINVFRYINLGLNEYCMCSKYIWNLRTTFLMQARTRTSHPHATRKYTHSSHTPMARTRHSQVHAHRTHTPMARTRQSQVHAHRTETSIAGTRPSHAHAYRRYTGKHRKRTPFARTRTSLAHAYRTHTPIAGTRPLHAHTHAYTNTHAQCWGCVIELMTCFVTTRPIKIISTRSCVVFVNS